jgi:hypothetical protein
MLFSCFLVPMIDDPELLLKENCYGLILIDAIFKLDASLNCFIQLDCRSACFRRMTSFTNDAIPTLFRCYFDAILTQLEVFMNFMF